MIGIVGQGFVGNAVFQRWKKYYTVQTYDIDDNKATSTLHNLVMMCDTIFVCLPTPMREDGSCDLNILESSLFEINTLTEFEGGRNKTVIILSFKLKICFVITNFHYLNLLQIYYKVKNFYSRIYLNI